MIKFKEFTAQPFDVHVTAFLKEESKSNPDNVFEYVDLKAIDRKLVILVYRQTSKSVYQLRSLFKEVAK